MCDKSVPICISCVDLQVSVLRERVRSSMKTIFFTLCSALVSKTAGASKKIHEKVT